MGSLRRFAASARLALPQAPLICSPFIQRRRPESNRHFNPLDPLPSDWPDSIASFISTITSNFEVTISPDPTVLQVVAGLDNALVSIGINGRWRFNTATVTAASPGGGTARWLDVWVTATDNSFEAGSPGEIDLTNYNFSLVIVESGVAPSGAVLSRKVGSAYWNGSEFVTVIGIGHMIPDDNSVTGGPAGPGVKIAEATITLDNIAGSVWSTMQGFGWALPADSVAAAFPGAFFVVMGGSQGAVLYQAQGGRWGQAAAPLGATLTKVDREVNVLVDDDATSPPSGVTVRGSIPIVPAAGEEITLVGVAVKCSTVGTVPSRFTIQWDHPLPGTLVNVPGLGSVTPAAGAYLLRPASGGPLALNALDEVTVSILTPGNSLGCKVALVTEHTS